MAEKKNADKTPPATTPKPADAQADPVIAEAEAQANLDETEIDQADFGAEAGDTDKKDEDGIPDSEPDDVADAAGDPPDKVESKPVIEGKAGTGAAKKAADKVKREAAIKAHQDAVADAPVDEKFEAVEKRKAEIIEKMDELAAEVAEHDEAINILRDESAELVLELYPQQGENDKPAVAIRGYLNASARERQHRKLAPVRLKALLQKAGLAPIDAAYSRARGRGMARPVRKALTQSAPAAADQAKDAIPTKKPAE